MNDRTYFTFLIRVFFKDWGGFSLLANTCSILGLIVAHSLDSEWPISRSIIVIVSVFVFTFMVKLVRQSYQYYQSFNRPIKAIRLINGDGTYKGLELVILENTQWVNKDVLLILYSGSSGSRQPICVLKVLDVDTNEIITAQYSEKPSDISKYFSEEARRASLFALPIIDALVFTWYVESRRT